MHSATRATVIVALAGILGGCLTVPTTRTDIRLTEVQRPQDVRDRWGDYEIREAEEEGFVYEDSLVHVTAIPSDPAFNLVIQNKTDHSLQLVWDQMSFVGPEGVASSVTSGETRMINVGRSQTPTPIPARSKVAVMAIPNSQITSSGLDTDIQPLYPASDSTRFEEIKGDNLRLIVPLRVEDTINEFTFVFEVRDIWLSGRRAEARESEGSG